MERPRTGHDDDGVITRRRFDRRAALKGTLAGASAATIGAILAACGGGGAPPNPPTTAPATAPQPTTGAAGTTAPTVASAAGSAPAPTRAAGSAVAGAAGTPAPAGAATPAGTPKRGGVLVVAVTTDAPSLEPHIDASTGRSLRTQLMYSYVVQTDKDLRIQPDLAEKWDISPDGKVYTFSLRKGVKFHNGRELVASDVKYSIERILDPANAAYGRGFLLSIQSIDTPDPYTAKMTLKGPDASLLASLASAFSAIVAKEEVDKAGGKLNSVDAGSGPFMLDQWIQGQAVKLKRNPNYYLQGQPYLDGITYQVIPEESAIIAQLKSGNVHLAVLNDNKNYDLVKDATNLHALRSPRMGFDYINIDNRKDPFTKQEVRQALSYALDRNEVLQAAYGGYGRITAPLPPPFADYALDPATIPQFKLDPDKAKQLLAQAGLANGFKTELQTIVGFPALINTAQVAAANWKKIGVEAEIKQIEYGTWIKGFQNHEFIMTTNGTAGNADPDAVLFPRLSTQGANNNSTSDTSIDELLLKGKTATDPKQRIEIYKQAQLTLAEKMPQVWTISADLIEVLKKSVGGYISHPSGFMQGLVGAWLEG